MKKYLSLSSVSVIITFLALVVNAAYAHERRVYQIGSQDYNFVVGFLNEPTSTGDKTGVDLMVNTGGMPTMGPDGDMDGPPTNTVNITGLEKTLKVEVSAGSEKKVMDFSPQWGNPGHYQAVFYPTIQTTYSFRIFGTVNKTPVSVTFDCNPSGQAPADDNKMTKISDGVTQKSKSGAYGCPASRSDLEFPASKVSIDQLVSQDIALGREAVNAGMKGTLGIIIGLLGLGAGVGAWMRKPKGPVV